MCVGQCEDGQDIIIPIVWTPYGGHRAPVAGNGTPVEGPMHQSPGSTRGKKAAESHSDPRSPKGSKETSHAAAVVSPRGKEMELSKAAMGANVAGRDGPGSSALRGVLPRAILEALDGHGADGPGSVVR